MSLIEQHLADAIVRYKLDIATGVDQVGRFPLPPHVVILEWALQGEQMRRSEIGRLAEEEADGRADHASGETPS